MSRPGGGDILAIDVGTSALKVAVFSPDLEKRAEARRAFEVRLHDQGMADIDPEAWWAALRETCNEVAADLGQVSTVSLSVTTPGLTPMAADGTALAPAILFLDGRSHRQAARIREIVGEDVFLGEACNLPVSGGSSLASMLWIRDERPDIWSRTAKFGHCNTYIVKRLTGQWCIDPSTTSITGLYNTARNDLTWNDAILAASGISSTLLPPLLESHAPVGVIESKVAAELGLPADAVVLCGGNDATLAAYSGGLTWPGAVNIISGTCDIASVCVDHPIASPHFNVRCHVVPGRWLTFFVLNTGGEAFDWFRRTFASELDPDQFYGEYLPAVLRQIHALDFERREAELPRYVPYLGGSRYSLNRLKAGFDGITLETTRDDMLLSLVRGNAEYLGEHLREVATLTELSGEVGISGGGARIDGMLEARRLWTGDFTYRYQEQSSLLGAAMLGQVYQAGGFGRPSPRRPAPTREESAVP